MSDYPTPKTRCKGCGYPITWAEQRKQYGRLARRGMAPDDIKAVVPRCQKCVTRWLRENETMPTIHQDGRLLTGDEWILPADFATEEIELGQLPSLKGSTELELPSLSEDMTQTSDNPVS